MKKKIKSYFLTFKNKSSQISLAFSLLIFSGMANAVAITGVGKLADALIATIKDNYTYIFVIGLVFAAFAIKGDRQGRAAGIMITVIVVGLVAYFMADLIQIKDTIFA